MEDWTQISRGEWLALRSMIAKGAMHRYLKRVPTGRVSKTGKPLYRYFYKPAGGAGSVLHDAHLSTVGAGFKVGDNGGHAHVDAVHGDGHVTLRHDETGRTERVHVSELRRRVEAAHGAAQGAHDAAAKARRAAELAAAEKHGSPKQKEAARKRAPAPARKDPGSHPEGYVDTSFDAHYEGYHESVRIPPPAKTPTGIRESDDPRVNKTMHHIHTESARLLKEHDRVSQHLADLHKRAAAGERIPKGEADGAYNAYEKLKNDYSDVHMHHALQPHSRDEPMPHTLHALREKVGKSRKRLDNLSHDVWFAGYAGKLPKDLPGRSKDSGSNSSPAPKATASQGPSGPPSSPKRAGRASTKSLEERVQAEREQKERARQKRVENKDRDRERRAAVQKEMAELKIKEDRARMARAAARNERGRQ